MCKSFCVRSIPSYLTCFWLVFRLVELSFYSSYRNKCARNVGQLVDIWHVRPLFSPLILDQFLGLLRPKNFHQTAIPKVSIFLVCFIPMVAFQESSTLRQNLSTHQLPGRASCDRYEWSFAIAISTCRMGKKQKAVAIQLTCKYRVRWSDRSLPPSYRQEKQRSN